MYHQKKGEEIKPGTSGHGSFVFPYFQPAASTDRLHLALTSKISKQGSRITSWPTTEELTVTAIEVKGKEHDGQPDEQEKELLRGGSVPGLHAVQDKL